MPNIDIELTEEKLQECYKKITQLADLYSSDLLKNEVDPDDYDILATEYDTLVTDPEVSFEKVRMLLQKLNEECEFWDTLYACREIIKHIMKLREKIAKSAPNDKHAAQLDAITDEEEAILDGIVTRKAIQLIKRREPQKQNEVELIKSFNSSDEAQVLGIQKLKEVHDTLSIKLREANIKIKAAEIAATYKVNDDDVDSASLQRLRLAFKSMYQQFQRARGKAHENEIDALQQGREILSKIDDCQRDRIRSYNAKLNPSKPTITFWFSCCAATQGEDVINEPERNLCDIMQDEKQLHRQLVEQLATAEVEMQGLVARPE